MSAMFRRSIPVLQASDRGRAAELCARVPQFQYDPEPSQASPAPHYSDAGHRGMQSIPSTIDRDLRGSKMEIRHLQSLIALAEQGSFTAAARKMNTVQSGVSVAIKEMEQELGVQLVNRTTRRVALTSAGNLFLEHARLSVALLNDGIAAVRSEKGVVQGRLHLGILQSLDPYLNLPALLARFRAKYPLVEFALRSLNSEEIPSQVRSGLIDLGFHAVVSGTVWPGIASIPFVQDPLVAICGRKHALARQKDIELHALRDEDFIDLTPERALRRLLDRVCSTENLSRHSTYEVSDVPTMLQLVSAGLGVAVVPLRLAQTANKTTHVHVLPFVEQDRLPVWAVQIALRTKRSSESVEKTAPDLFLDMLQAPEHSRE